MTIAGGFVTTAVLIASSLSATARIHGRHERFAGHAGQPVPAGACEDADESEAPRPANCSQAAAGEKAIAIENDIRGLLRNFGLKVGVVGSVKFGDRIRDLLEGMPDLAELMESLLVARDKLRQEYSRLHRKVLALARNDAVCNRLMTIPGVGPVIALAFISTIDVPARFRNSKAVGPALGLTPVLNQSGESTRVGRVSLCGDSMMRTLFYQAAQVMLTRVKNGHG